MINLLPDDIKKEIIYGRRNRILRHWVLLVCLVVIAVAAMTVVGELLINRNINATETTAKLTQTQISNQNLAATQSEIQSLSNNFKTVTQILSKQLLFSKLFIKIGSIIPDGVILSEILITNTSSSLDLNIAATNHQTANQAFININDPSNGLFAKADLISIDCAQSTPSSSTNKYPCTGEIAVTMKANSSFYYLNSITNNGSND